MKNTMHQTPLCAETKAVTDTLDREVQEAILKALDRGNSVEVKRNRDGIVVMEVTKTIKYKVPVASGRREEPKGAGSD